MFDLLSWVTNKFKEHKANENYWPKSAGLLRDWSNLCLFCVELGGIGQILDK